MKTIWACWFVLLSSLFVLACGSAVDEPIVDEVEEPEQTVSGHKPGHGGGSGGSGGTGGSGGGCSETINCATPTSPPPCGYWFLVSSTTSAGCVTCQWRDSACSWYPTQFTTTCSSCPNATCTSGCTQFPGQCYSWTCTS